MSGKRVHRCGSIAQLVNDLVNGLSASQPYPSFRRWIINERGYATIVPSEEDDVVYGLLYEITQLNMDELDKYESHYDKVLMDIEDPTAESDETRRILHDTLVYVERKTNEGPPKTEYIYRMNQAIADAVKEGVPKDYIDRYLRKFIPAEPPSLPN
ncbi:hypothetical protein M378DRAFT_13610 [Amanita muscaria Koide BX008]|uniref:Gamma-glutamylcyclotransferase n=1 Tax=Amanita muscaria (strain Koide BX008) TaxID=946122 RepID=A0A0C2WY35_AMAMK|nr:hypothetical protein M378DRAFT_13610 [Amanita muscaria Koide BX008]